MTIYAITLEAMSIWAPHLERFADRERLERVPVDRHRTHVCVQACVQVCVSICTALRIASGLHSNACMKADAVLCMPHDCIGTGASRFIVYRQSSSREARRRNTALIGKATLREACRNAVSYIGHRRRYTGTARYCTGTQAHRCFSHCRACASGPEPGQALVLVRH